MNPRLKQIVLVGTRTNWKLFIGFWWFCQDWGNVWFKISYTVFWYSLKNNGKSWVKFSSIRTIASWNIRPLNLSIKESTKIVHGLKIKPNFSPKSSSIFYHNSGNTKTQINGMTLLENYFSDPLTNSSVQANSAVNVGTTILIPTKKGNLISYPGESGIKKKTNSSSITFCSMAESGATSPRNLETIEPNIWSKIGSRPS